MVVSRFAPNGCGRNHISQTVGMMALMMLMTLVPTSPADACQRARGRVEEGGMSVDWSMGADSVELRLAAPTTGWLAVGFNDRPTLDGTRLFMVRVVDGKGEVEEHLADPPNHAPRDPAHAAGSAKVLSASVVEGATTATIRVAHSDFGGVEIGPGGTYHLTIAWSRSGDWQHHSAFRSAVEVGFPAR
jgi:hypothetical protein